MMINQNFDQFITYFDQLGHCIHNIDNLISLIRRQKASNREVMSQIVHRFQSIIEKKQHVMKVHRVQSTVKMLKLMSEFPAQIERLKQVKSYVKALEMVEYFEGLQEVTVLKSTRVFQKYHLAVIESKLFIQERLYRQFSQEYLDYFGQAYLYQTTPGQLCFLPASPPHH